MQILIKLFRSLGCSFDVRQLVWLPTSTKRSVQGCMCDSALGSYFHINYARLNLMDVHVSWLYDRCTCRWWLVFILLPFKLSCFYSFISFIFFYFVVDRYDKNIHLHVLHKRPHLFIKKQGGPKKQIVCPVSNFLVALLLASFSVNLLFASRTKDRIVLDFYLSCQGQFFPLFWTGGSDRRRSSINSARFLITTQSSKNYSRGQMKGLLLSTRFQDVIQNIGLQSSVVLILMR